MAEKIVSPGVFTKEIDQSFLPAAIGEIGGAIIGPTVKGPVLIPTVVTSYSEYQQKFGDSFKSGSSYYQYLTSHTAREYLKHAPRLTVVRVAGDGYSHASSQVSSSVTTTGVAYATGSISASSFWLNDTITIDDTKFTFVKDNTNFTQTAGQMFVTLGDGGATTTGFGTGSIMGNANTASNPDTEHYYFVTASTSNPGFPDSAQTEYYTQYKQTVLNLVGAINSSSIHGLGLTATASFGGTTAAIVISGSSSGTGANLSGSIVDENGLFPTNGVGVPRIEFGNYHGHFGGTNVTDIGFTASAAGATHVIGGGTNTTTQGTSFKLHTLADGATQNSIGSGVEGAYGLLDSGSKDNYRWEVTSKNNNKGTFTLTIRQGSDTHKRKQILETFNNLSLDPNAKNYAGKLVGTQVQTIRTDENDEPYLQLSGSYPNKSKYVRIEVVEQTVDYLDENGDIRDSSQTDLLPALGSGSFQGGSDGNTVNEPFNFYHHISEDNSQGLDPSNNGGANGYNGYETALNLIKNQDEYDINLLLLPGIISEKHTSIATKAIDVAEDRGDCFVILDPVVYNASVTNATTEAETRDSNYTAMYWPWVKVPDVELGKQVWVPPSTVLPGVLAFNDKVAHEWFAPAGLNRGGIDSAIMAERKLTQSDRDSLYESNVNPIATFPGQGVTVWGQKTLQKKASALDRVNVRRLLIRLKKFIASSSRFLVFEQNTAKTRQRFLGIVNPFLEQVQSNSGLSAFKVVMDDTNNTPDLVDRNQLYGQIFVQPTRTAEFIVLDFTIQPTGATFPE